MMYAGMTGSAAETAFEPVPNSNPKCFRRTLVKEARSSGVKPADFWFPLGLWMSMSCREGAAKKSYLLMVQSLINQ